jgi:hypothetical protein
MRDRAELRAVPFVIDLKAADIETARATAKGLIDISARRIGILPLLIELSDAFLSAR